MTLSYLRRALADGNVPDSAPQSRFEVRPLDPADPLRDLVTPPAGIVPRQAAVLIPLFHTGEAPHILLTVRSDSLGAHAGQISFPGGTRDPEDQDLETTALRELAEELSIPATAVELIGRLSPTYLAVTNFLVTPFVGIIEPRPHYQPNEEVAEVLEVPLAALLAGDAVAEERRQLGGRAYQVAFYQHGPHKIWGATARMLSMLLAL